MVSSSITGFATNEFTSSLNALVRELSVEALPPTFSVPRLDGAPALPVGFETGFTTLSVSATRMLAGIGMRISAPPGSARPTLGAPVETGLRLLDVPNTAANPFAVASHISLLNQGLHALWRGGYFDANLTAGALGGLVPADTSVRIITALPPAARLVGTDRLEIAAGGISVVVQGPAFGGQPIDATLGGRVSCRTGLQGSDVKLDECSVDDLRVTASAALDAATEEALEALLSATLERVMTLGADSALPALPLPAYRIPASLGDIGLPVGSSLGVRNPTFRQLLNHVIVEGGFGIR
jgi:hypothetical protein